MKPKRSAAANNLIWLGIAQGAALTMLAKGVGFGTTLVQSNGLGGVAYGQYAALLSTVALFGIGAQASLGAAASNLVSRHWDKSPAQAESILSAIFSILLVTSILASVLLIATARPMATGVYRSPEMAGGIAISSLALIALACQSVVDGALAATRAFLVRNTLPFIQAVTFLLFATLLTHRAGLLGAISAYTLSCGPSLLLGTIVLSRKLNARDIRLRLFLPKAPYGTVARFALPMCTNAAIVVGTSWIITTSLARTTGGFTAVGEFNIATQLRVLLLTVPFLLHSTYTPLLGSALGVADVETFRSRFLECYRLTLASSIASATLLVLLAEPLSSLFGRDLRSAAPAIALSGILATLMSVCNLLGVALIAQGYARQTMLPNVTSSGLAIVLAIACGGRYGSVGVIMALIAGQLCQMWLLSRQLNKREVRAPTLSQLIFSTIGLFAIFGASFMEWPMRAVASLPLSIVLLALAVANLPLDMLKTPLHRILHPLRSNTL